MTGMVVPAILASLWLLLSIIIGVQEGIKRGASFGALAFVAMIVAGAVFCAAAAGVILLWAEVPR